jgi:hypothetical protein
MPRKALRGYYQALHSGRMSELLARSYEGDLSRMLRMGLNPSMPTIQSRG